MTSIVIVKGNDGKLHGLGEENERAYNRWRRLVGNMDIGETLEFSFTIPRDPKHHRRFFALVRALMERTEALTVFDDMRHWLVIGAGYVEPDGAGGYKAHSLKYAEMEEVEFSELMRKVKDFLCTERAQRFLWRSLTDAQRHEMVEQVLADPREQGQ